MGEAESQGMTCVIQVDGACICRLGGLNKGIMAFTCPSAQKQITSPSLALKLDSSAAPHMFLVTLVPLNAAAPVLEPIVSESIS